MKLSDEKIKILKKVLPELYESIVSTSMLLEGDLNFIKNIPREEVEKLDKEDPSSLNLDLKLGKIKSRASAIHNKLKKTVEEYRELLAIDSRISLSDFLLSKEVSEYLTFDEKFIASAVATAVSKIQA